MRKEKIKKICALSLGVATLAATFGGCTQGNDESSTDSGIREVTICTSGVQAYLDAETSETQYEMLNRALVGDDCQSVNLTYQHESGKNYRMFCFGLDDDTEFVLRGNRGRIVGGLFVPGLRYHYKIIGAPTKELNINSVTEWKDEYEQYVVQEEDIVIQENSVRYISLERGYNYRDLGGWVTENGEQIDYGKIYRGGKTNSFNDQDISVFRDILHIKSEIDLRNSRDNGGQTSCILGEEYTYLSAPLGQYSYILPSFRTENRWHDANSPVQIKRIFEFLSDENNYPLFFHCNAGADRTGTLAFLICGYLGVPLDDLTRDFELTSFSQGGKRARGALELPFEYGIMQDDTGNFVAWGDMIDRMQTDYPAEDGKLSSSIRTYLTSACGITEQTLEKIRNILTTPLE